jgi:hypothetical protein
MEFYEGKVAFKVLHHDLYLGIHLFESTVHAHKEFGTGEQFTEQQVLA